MFGHSLLCPLCCSCLLSSLGVSSVAFCHLVLLSHPMLLLFLAWVSSFAVYSGLGLRCCGPGYGSSLFWGGGGLSFPCPCFSLAITTFSFRPGNLGFLDFLLGFFFHSTSSVSLVVHSRLRLMFQSCPVSSLAVCLSGLFFVSSFFWLRPSKLLGVVLR